jgi:putative ABC transport system substrate-binding protein
MSLSLARLAHFVLPRAALAALLLCAGPLPAQEPAVVSVLSRETLPYRDAEAAMREVLGRHSISVRTIMLNNAGVLAPGLLPPPRSAVVTFGQRAGDLLAVGTYPAQVSCMSLEPIGRASVVLAHSAEARIERMRRLFPRGGTVGLLRVQGNSELSKLVEFQRMARRAGMNVVVHEVDLKHPLGPQLDSLSDRIDVLMATYDLRIFSTANAQPILLFSYRHRIPVIGVSDAWTRAGALMSFDWDYPDIGRQCGEMLIRYSSGRMPDKPVVETPRRLVYSLNLEAARFFLINPPPDLMDGARQKFN